MIILKVRKSDGRVVRRITVSRPPRPLAEMETETHRYCEAPRPIAPGPLKLGGNNRLYALKPADVATPLRLLTIRRHELRASDEFAASDHPERERWLPYRQALRDLTGPDKQFRDDVKALIRRFPKRPDGTDAIAHLR